MTVSDMDKVRALYQRLAHPWWMREPRSWIWARPEDGAPQGFGLVAHQSPGLANLLWLSMEMDRPPHTYNAIDNGLYSLILIHGNQAMLEGEPLVDMAGLLTLEQFAARLPATQRGNALERAYPLLKMLAERRIPHADT